MITAKYTEVLYNLLNNTETKALIDEKMSTYPLYISTSKQEYGIPNIIPTREELNKKILNYYKYKEIGFETVGRFLDELEISLNEIMPYYNQLFFSADQDYNIIYNVDYKRTIDRNLQGDTTSTSTGETTSNSSDSTSTSTTTNLYNKNVESDTPQSQLGITNKQIDSVDYANKVTWNKDTTEQSGTSTGTATTTADSTASGTGSNTESESTLETTKGNFGVVSAQDLIEKYRKLIINIEQMIINDPRITELFMLIY